MKTCRICACVLVNRKDFNLVAGTSEFRPIDSIIELSFSLGNSSPYVCQRCKTALKNVFEARKKVRNVENELRNLHVKTGYLCEERSNDTFEVVQQQPACCKSNNLSKADKDTQTNMTFDSKSNTQQQETVAFVYVNWPSGGRIRKLPSDLTKMAIYLLRTQNKNMAKFALKHPQISSHLRVLIAKEISKGCQGMC